MRANEFITEEAKAARYNGLLMKYAFNNSALVLKAFDPTKTPIAYVKFVKEDKELYPQDLWVHDDFRNRGIAKSMYDFLKSEGYVINRSHDQTKAGAGFWDKHRGEDEYVWEEEVDEMALKQFTPLGDFNKPGPFRGVDKRLVPHPTNQLKTQKFFEQTPYDFRLFFSNIPGTGKYSETGPVNTQQLVQMFGEDNAQQILDGSDDTITVVFVGNSGDSKVMMTPWIMAHRIGHAIQAGARRGDRNGTWTAAEQHFFQGINNLLVDFYGRSNINQNARTHFNTAYAKEYNALFNAIGTQRSSRNNQITRPYEFMYELFAQYLGTGKITLNPLPKKQGYGRQAWGKSTKELRMQPSMHDESEYTTEVLARDMELMFDDVLSSLVGKTLVM